MAQFLISDNKKDAVLKRPLLSDVVKFSPVKGPLGWLWNVPGGYLLGLFSYSLAQTVFWNISCKVLLIRLPRMNK